VCRETRCVITGVPSRTFQSTGRQPFTWIRLEGSSCESSHSSEAKRIRYVQIGKNNPPRQGPGERARRTPVRRADRRRHCPRRGARPRHRREGVRPVPGARRKAHSSDTFKFYRYFLQSFCDAHGTRRSAPEPIHVTQWMDAFPWNPTTRNRAASCVKRSIRYGHRAGRPEGRSLEGDEEGPAAAPRATDRRRERKLIFDSVTTGLSGIPVRTPESGTRPGEVGAVA